MVPINEPAPNSKINSDALRRRSRRPVACHEKLRICVHLFDDKRPRHFIGDARRIANLCPARTSSRSRTNVSFKRSSRMRPLMGWTAPAPRHRRAMVAVGVVSHSNAGAVPMQISIVGLDIAKHVFQVHTVESEGHAVAQV
jgi:hypothetical protein